MTMVAEMARQRSSNFGFSVILLHFSMWKRPGIEPAINDSSPLGYFHTNSPFPLVQASAQMNCTKGENKPEFDLNRLNGTGVKTPLEEHEYLHQTELKLIHFSTIRSFVSPPKKHRWTVKAISKGSLFHKHKNCTIAACEHELFWDETKSHLDWSVGRKFLWSASSNQPALRV